VKLEDQMLNLM